MATVDPYGPAFQQLSQNLVNIFLQREAGARDQQRINILRDRERRLADATDLKNAVEGFGLLLNYVKPGKTVAEQPIIHKHLQTITGLDPKDASGLGGMVLEDLQPEDLVREDMVEYWMTLREESPETIAMNMERFTNFRNLQRGVTNAELRTGAMTWQHREQAVREFMVTEEYLEQSALNVLGLEEKIPVMVGDQTFSLNTSDAASLSARMNMHADEMGHRWATHRFDQTRWNDTIKMRYANDLQETSQMMGLNVGIGRATAIVEDYGHEDGMVRLQERAMGHTETIQGINSELSDLNKEREIAVLQLAPPNVIEGLDRQIRDLEADRQVELDNLMAVELFSSAVDINAAGEDNVLEHDPQYQALRLTMEAMEDLGQEMTIEPDILMEHISQRLAEGGHPSLYQEDPWGPDWAGRGPRLTGTREYLANRIDEVATQYMNGDVTYDDIYREFRQSKHVRDAIIQEIVTRRRAQQARDTETEEAIQRSGEPR